MFKHLTLAFLAANVFTGCVLTTGDTSDTLSDTSVNPPETGDTTADVITGGTTAEPATESAEAGTTADVPTTGTPGDTGDTGGTTADPTATTGGGLYGNCGWKEDVVSYYACAVDGGVPGVEDPLAENPIACADGLAAGDPCDDENGPVGGVGCCTGEGVLYFCDFTDPDMPVIFEQDCG